MAAKKYSSLPRTKNTEMEEDRKGSITSVYDYEPVVSVDEIDPLQRFRHVKVEATSFTVSEPFTELEVEPVLYTFANEVQRKILRENYEICPFNILTIKLERIFADKILAAEFYYNRNLYFDVAKHVYDVSIMMELSSIKVLLHDTSELLRMINYKRLEETRRIGSDLAKRPFRDYKIFDGIDSNALFEAEFQKMQRNYVFNEADVLSIEFVIQQWKTLHDILFQLDI